jgi:hypothetical protein
VLEDRQSAAVQILEPQLAYRDGLRRFVTMVCLRPVLNESVTLLVSELLAQLSGDPAHPEAVCEEVLDRWRGSLDGTSDVTAVQA